MFLAYEHHNDIQTDKLWTWTVVSKINAEALVEIVGGQCQKALEVLTIVVHLFFC